MDRGGFPVTSDVAATRWQCQPSPRQAPFELDDFELLRWVRAQSADPQAMRAASFRRRYERDWVSADTAARRVMCERGEVLGARVASALAALAVPPLMLLTMGGTAVQAAGLSIALAIAGSLTLLWRGAEVVARLAVLQAVAVTALVIGRVGIATALFVAMYVPAIAMAAAALIGSRAGLAVAGIAHARMRERIAPASAASESARPEDAVAA